MPGESKASPKDHVIGLERYGLPLAFLVHAVSAFDIRWLHPFDEGNTRSQLHPPMENPLVNFGIVIVRIQVVVHLCRERGGVLGVAGEKCKEALWPITIDATSSMPTCDKCRVALDIIDLRMCENGWE
jgi:hypothetical protein